MGKKLICSNFSAQMAANRPSAEKVKATRIRKLIVAAKYAKRKPVKNPATNQVSTPTTSPRTIPPATNPTSNSIGCSGAASKSTTVP